MTAKIRSLVQQLDDELTKRAEAFPERCRGEYKYGYLLAVLDGVEETPSAIFSLQTHIKNVQNLTSQESAG